MGVVHLPWAANNLLGIREGQADAAGQQTEDFQAIHGGSPVKNLGRVAWCFSLAA